MSTDVSEVSAASIIRAMMEAARISETSIDIQLRTRQYIPEESEIHISLPPWQLEISQQANSCNGCNSVCFFNLKVNVDITALCFNSQKLVFGGGNECKVTVWKLN
jgi:hypothetical protein